LANNIQRENVKSYLKINENDNVLLNVSDTVHNYNALFEAIINRQIVCKPLKRKGTQKLYERLAKLMH